MVVLVTGANGQLGQAIQFISGKYPEIDFVFCSSSKLDVTNLENCQAVFSTYQPQVQTKFLRYFLKSRYDGLQ